MKNILTTSALVAFSAAAASAANIFVPAGDISVDTTWTSANEYILQGPVFVKDGATLTINAGTIVRGQPRKGPTLTDPAQTPGAIIVTRTGRIVANGSKTNPVIFTTAAIDVNADGIADSTSAKTFTAFTGVEPLLDASPKTAPLAPLDPTNGNSQVSLWGGIVICGNAPTNLADFAGVGFGKGIVEGLTVPGFPAADATYGGTVATDSSGKLEYVSIRHAGDEIGNSNELNGLTLAGVGSGTILSNVEVYCNFDDGIEWFGGTVNGENLVVVFAGDDAFDMDQGYTGTNNFLFAVQPFFKENDTGNFGSASGDKAGEWDGDDSVLENFSGSLDREAPDNVAVSVSLDFLTPTAGSEIAAPFSNPAVFNMTVLGSEPSRTLTQEFTPTTARGAGRGVDMRHGFAGRLFSSIIVNTDQGIDVRKGTLANRESDGVTVIGSPADGSIIADADENAANGLIVVANTTFLGTDAADFGTAENNAIANGDVLTTAINDNKINPAIAMTALIVNADQSFNPQGNASGLLDGTLKATKLDPRSKLGANNVNQIGGLFGGPKVTYRGAFTTNTAASSGRLVGLR